MSEISPLHPPSLTGQNTITWGNLLGASAGLALSTIIAKNKQPVLIITPDTMTAQRLEYELQFFQQPQTSQMLISFPDWETLPYDQFSPHQDIISDRLSALHQIPMLQQGAIIISISTLMHRLAPCDFLDGNIFLLKQGEKLNRDATRASLAKAGYRCVEQVREHGEFAVRGAIIDLFPMGSDTPYRLDLFDDDIESIRTFSPDTQRSLEKVDHITLLPAKEFPINENSIELFRQQWRSQFGGNPINCPVYNDVSASICSPGVEYYLPLFFEKTATLFDYIPKNSLIFTIGNVHQRAEEFWQEIQTRYEQRAHDIIRPILPAQRVFIPVPEIFSSLRNYTQVKINPEIASNVVFSTQEPITLKIDNKAAQPLNALENFLLEYTGRVLFCAETAGRREVLLQLFNTIQLKPVWCESWKEFLDSNTQYGITIAAIDDGLTLTDPALTIIAEAQLFGERIKQRRQRKETTQDIDAIVKDLTELQVGDPVVHIDHGVGRYLGLQTLKVGETLAEYLNLEYAEGDKLYVPVASLHLISRYSGAEPEHAPLHKLGTEQWRRAKRKAAEQATDVAAELLDIYAKREARAGFAAKELDGQYALFSAAFPFEETPDQQKAIEQVIRDMASEKPMDRLVCGDVGFGKTEVAMRAAFIAAQNGKQVAVLVPTTLLAQQHYQNFQDRFADWPIQVAVMSRFQSSKEQKKTLEHLEQGKVDIIFGTSERNLPDSAKTVLAYKFYPFIQYESGVILS